MITNRGVVNASIHLDAAAILLTDNCVIDKRVNENPAVKKLQFAPLYELASREFSNDKLEQLRSGELNPADICYVDLKGFGDLTGGLEEACFLLSESYSLPANYFKLIGMTDADATGDSFRTAIGMRQRDTRILNMDPRERRLLQEKLSFFWVSALLEPICDECKVSVARGTGTDWIHSEGEPVGHWVTHTRSYQALIRDGKI
jgi:hypothetical protein